MNTVDPSTEQATHQPTKSRRMLWRSLVCLLLIAVICVIAWAWWSFWTLAQSQSIKVSLISGSGTVGDVAVSPGKEATASVGHTVQTGADGFAAAVMGDGTRLSVSPATRVRIVEAARSRSNTRTKTKIQLEDGGLSIEIPTWEGVRRKIQFSTAAATIDAGESQLLLHQRANSTRVMVARGTVEVTAADGTIVVLKANQGTLIEVDRAPQVPTSLLAPPRLVSPSEGGSSESGAPEFRWESVPGAVSSVLEIASDQNFSKPFIRRSTSVTRAALKPIVQDGIYFWRVASVDKRGLQGRWSAPFPFEQVHFQQQARLALMDLKLDDALSLFEKSGGAVTEELALLTERGVGALRNGDYSEARTVFNMVAKLAPTNAQAQNGLAEAAYHLNDYHEARVAYENLLSHSPDNADAKVGLALIDVREGRFAEGLARTQGVLTVEPAHRRAMQVAAMAHTGLDELTQARTIVARILDRYPDDMTALALQETLLNSDSAKRRLVEQLVLPPTAGTLQ